MAGLTRREALAAAVGGASLAGCDGEVAPARVVAGAPTVRGEDFFKGVNFTAEGPHPYGSVSAGERLARLPDYGVNAVALVPYAAQRLGDSEIRFPLRMERDEAIEADARRAREHGLRVVLKPQVWVRGGYPGDLEIQDAGGRAAWFASYRRLVAHYAALATRIEAAVFCVGVEFARLTPYENEWRELIKVAREGFGGPLTYAANFGEEFESVGFWDALDYIGLDNYYPLPEDLSTDAVVERVERVQRRYGKPVLMTEVGFTPHERTHERPWEDEPGGAFSLEAQTRATEATLRGFYGREWLAGMFWWKVGTCRGGVDDPSHRLWGKPALDAIGRWYRGDRG